MGILRRTEAKRLIDHRASRAVLSWKGPLLRLDDLDEAEVALISKDFYELVRGQGYGGTELYRIYVGVLNTWGVMCPTLLR